MVPLPVALKMVLRGTIRDGKTIASVLWLDHASRSTLRRVKQRLGSEVAPTRK